MLDSETKHRLDTLRDILVGKVPDPKSQVDQITTGLIYKFMNDMDTASFEAGGKRKFFKGEFRKYSWDKLFDPKVGGVERVKLYGEAIERMYKNPSAPPLFREIFKNTYLPFRDPSTLNMFLTEIGEFHYSHSEKLGDAYEYLLSYMGSQGDAGQFRTPRHIIDFIVEIVSPRKNETILDPACGTAGFLISSFKYIMRDKKKLWALDLNNLSKNLVGYDISPDMTRLSLVNMYLHNFTNPKIYEYDTLSSDDRWNEYFDVILANPPFFSPKGGIQPHSRFSLDSKRAEVLFVDYIIQHLKPNGRAGIIVPEGIIFQTGRAYKALRRKLIDDCLVGVISLPAGVFQPYSGVKTSILILDQRLARDSEFVFFAKVENDGFSLGAQRTPIEGNELPTIISKFNLLYSSKSPTHLSKVKKSEILSSHDVGLSYNRYVGDQSERFEYAATRIGEICDVFNGSTPNRNNKVYWQEGEIPWFTIEDLRDQGYVINQTKQKITQKAVTETSVTLLPPESTLICCTASVGECAYSTIQITTNQQFNGLVVKPKCKNLVDTKFLFWMAQNLKSDLIRNSGSTSFNFVSVRKLKEIKIPLPPIEIQQEIVKELDGYQKIIDGARQVVENLRPCIDIREEFSEKEISKFKNVSITDVAKFYRGVTYKKSQEVNHGGIAILRANNVSLGGKLLLKDVKNVSKNVSIREDQWLKAEDILMCIASGSKGHIGKTTIIEDNLGMAFGGFMGVLRSNDRVLPKFLFGILQHKAFNDYLSAAISGANINNIKESILSGFKFDLPPIKSQSQLVKQLLNEQETVEKNSKLIETYTKKIQDRIAKVWGE